MKLFLPCWIKPIDFKMDGYLYVAYGWPKWCSRSVWMVEAIED